MPVFRVDEPRVCKSVVTIERLFMTQIRNVSGTAFVVAEFRAEENGQVIPLYRDLVVNLFLDEQSKAALVGCRPVFPRRGTW
jgi:hypothetical protein